jgi:hypothetical protein
MAHTCYLERSERSCISATCEEKISRRWLEMTIATQSLEGKEIESTQVGERADQRSFKGQEGDEIFVGCGSRTFTHREMERCRQACASAPYGFEFS